MNMLKTALVSAAIALIGIGIYSWSQRAQNRELATTLIVGTCDDYPPYTFQKDGQLVGFDIDLVNHIGKHLAKNVEFKNISFNLLLLELIRGSIHLVAAGISPTEERAKRVLFSKNYMYGSPFIVVSTQDHRITSIEQCFGKRVGVNEGYTADHYVSQFPEIKIVRFDAVPNGLLALSTHKIDAFVTSHSSILPLLESQPDHGLVITPIADTGESCALAISKHYPELTKQINATLTELEEDGTLDDLRKKWGLA